MHVSAWPNSASSKDGFIPAGRFCWVPITKFGGVALGQFFFYRKRTVPVKVPTPLSLQIPSLLLFALLAGSGFVSWII